LGFNVELTPEWPLASMSKFPALRFPDQAQFHILRFINGLVTASMHHGAQFFTGAHVVRVEDGTPCTVATDQGRTVRASSVVVATNTPVNDLVTMHAKQAAYRTYVIGVRVAPQSVPSGLYWDTLDPYHYVRLLSDDQYDGELLIV